MPPNDQAPATKADVELILGHLKLMHEDMEGMATKEELAQLREEIAKDITDAEHRILVKLENARQDLLDAKNDDVENIKIRQNDHEDRLVRLEHVVRLPS